MGREALRHWLPKFIKVTDIRMLWYWIMGKKNKKQKETTGQNREL